MDIKYTKDNTIILGKYPFYEDGSMAPIRWTVIAEEDEKCLILTKNAIDCLPYNTGMNVCTWENCSLRTYLNTLIDKMFDPSERQIILETVHKNKDNCLYRAKGGEPSNGGNDTKDILFVLDSSQVIQYLSEEQRFVKPTPWTAKKGAFTDSSGNVSWWLREPGMKNVHAAYVRYDGTIVNQGYFVNNTDFAVRVAMFIKK